MTLEFKLSKHIKDIQQIYNYNAEVFSDTADFDWTLDNIKKEVENGWQLYSVAIDGEIIAAAFVKISDESLWTKNTPIKLSFQGNGYSHQIKDFYEQLAKKEKVKKIYNVCRTDNFRMISLNESHGYGRLKLGHDGNKTLVEWVKDVRKKGKSGSKRS